MTRQDTPGTVRDLSGRMLYATDSVEGAFLDEVRRAQAGGRPIFVVVGTDERPEFAAALREVCEVVVDEAANGTAVVVEGDASEWPASA